MQDGFAWPIIDVQPGTTYEVEVTITSGATTALRSLNHTTRALPSAAGPATVVIQASATASQISAAIDGAPAGAVIEFANGTYNLNAAISITNGGTSGSTKYLRGQSRAGVTLARSTVGSIFSLNGSVSDIVIEDLTARGNGVDQNGDTAFDYTAVLTQGSDSTTVTRITMRRVTASGIDRAAYMYNARQMLVYDNTFTGNNLWQTIPVNFLESNRTWNDDGLNLSGLGNCGFNNSLKGFGDTCSYAQHTGGSGGANGVGIHFYRNDIRNSCDDPIEADYGRRNLTFYDNRVHNSVNAGSLDPLFGGPYLQARNIFINTYRVNTYKWNSTNTGQFLYNNTIVSTVTRGVDADVAGWYQPNNGQQRSYGLRNNILVYRGNGITLWIESTGHDPLDWTHNSWFPNREIQFGGGFYSNLTALQSSLSNRTPIFSGTNRPFANDNITEQNPWTTNVDLPANSGTEVSATYTPALASGSAAKNSGIAIPNITEGFTGAAPDRGAVISGRTLPIFGDRSF